MAAVRPPNLGDGSAPSPPDKFDLALDASKRLLDNQFSAVDTIQTKVGVLLGFSVSTLGIVFSLGAGWIAAHRLLGLGSASLLVASAIFFAWSLRVQEYRDVPDPEWLWKQLNSPEVDGTRFRKRLIANYNGAFNDNRTKRDDQFQRINWGIGFLVVGIAVFSFGVLLFP
jgi:hypothetical protein